MRRINFKDLGSTTFKILISRKRKRRSIRDDSLKNGKFYSTIVINGMNIWKCTYVSKFGIKSNKKPAKIYTTSYAYQYKIFGYKDLDELYQITGKGKYRNDKL